MLMLRGMAMRDLRRSEPWCDGTAKPERSDAEPEKAVEVEASLGARSSDGCLV
jgi:hypothetical protein